MHRLTTEAMAMGKLHKDVGQLIVQSAEDPDRSDSQVIKVSLPHTSSFRWEDIIALNLIWG